MSQLRYLLVEFKKNSWQNYRAWKNEAFATKQNYVGQMVKMLQKFEVEVLKISWEKAVFFNSFLCSSYYRYFMVIATK